MYKQKTNFDKFLNWQLVKYIREYGLYILFPLGATCTYINIVKVREFNHAWLYITSGIILIILSFILKDKFGKVNIRKEKANKNLGIFSSIMAIIVIVFIVFPLNFTKNGTIYIPKKDSAVAELNSLWLADVSYISKSITHKKTFLVQSKGKKHIELIRFIIKVDYTFTDSEIPVKNLAMLDDEVIHMLEHKNTVLKKKEIQEHIQSPPKSIEPIEPVEAFYHHDYAKEVMLHLQDKIKDLGIDINNVSILIEIEY
jgi:hypothetical protein